MNKVYVSPVCHLNEVAAQMNVICTSGEDTPILGPDQEGHGPLGPSVAPRRI